MLTGDSRLVADKAKKLYESALRAHLEATNRDRYVAIEPMSGEYFLGDTFDDAVNAALDRYPDRLTHTIRIGHAAAFHLGVLTQ